MGTKSNKYKTRFKVVFDSHNRDGKETNLFKDGRTYASKSYAQTVANIYGAHSAEHLYVLPVKVKLNKLEDCEKRYQLKLDKMRRKAEKLVLKIENQIFQCEKKSNSKNESAHYWSDRAETLRDVLKLIRGVGL